MVRGVPKEDAWRGARRDLVGGNGRDVRVAQAAEHPHAGVVGVGAIEERERGVAMVWPTWSAVQQECGRVQGLCPVCERHAGMHEEGADYVIEST